jgi:hypothetical protein
MCSIKRLKYTRLSIFLDNIDLKYNIIKILNTILLQIIVKNYSE